MAVNITNSTSAIKLEITTQTGDNEPEVYFLEKSITNIAYDVAGSGFLKLTNVKYPDFRFAFAEVTLPAEANIVDLANAIQEFKTTAGPAMPLPAGASTEATLATRATEATLATRASESTLSTRLSESDFDTKIGSLTETAPATDTASSGLNGRLQRIAQRIASLIGLIPTSLGQKTMANSMAVVVASDQSNVPVSQATASSLNAQVVGNIAHDAADSGNPIKVGGKAKTSDITPVANDDRVDALFTKLGKQVVMPYTLPDSLVSGLTASMTGTGDTAVIAAQGANVAIFVTNILVTNGHATVGTYVNIKNGATSIYTGYAAAAGGGFSVTLPTPLKLTANTALNAANVTTGSDVRVSASGYKASTV